jgi:hypothetical protein
MQDVRGKVQHGCSEVPVKICCNVGKAFVRESIPVDRDARQPGGSPRGRRAGLRFFLPYITDSFQPFKQVGPTDRSEQVMT